MISNISQSANKATRNLVEWIEKPKWTPLLFEVYDSHLFPIAEVSGIPEDEVPESLGPAWEMLYTFILDDFFTVWFGEHGEINVIDDYLKRRGWRESVPGRRYLTAVRDSSPSLYEVVELDSGRSIKLKDLIGGEMLVVQEKTATKILRLWDCMAARVVCVNGSHYLTGGVLYFSRAMSREFLKSTDEAVKATIREIRRDLRKRHGKSKRPVITRQMALDRLPITQMLSTSWALSVLVAEETAAPEIRNTDDEPILLCEVRFALRGNIAEVAAVLDTIPGLERSHEPDASEEARTSGKTTKWDWLAPGDPSYRSSQLRKGTPLPEEITADTEADIGITRLGHLVLGSEWLILTTNSKGRGERGQALLVSYLGSLVGRSVASYGDPMKTMEDLDKAGFSGGETVQVPPEKLTQAMHDYLDRHYRRVLDEPVPVLGGMTPREAAKGRGKSRTEVIEWLKGLQNTELRRAQHAGDVAYDSDWMWKELGIRKPG
ncbi:MAG: hypothetical protein OXG56_02495 [Gammaproteobacteria bacterium]|nr:hypothetical protein [Gammaproteobacteria bacterium]